MASFDLTPQNTGLLVIDVQDRFQASLPGIRPNEPVGRALRILLEGARLLSVPVIISEQYVKGLGPTLPHVIEAAGPNAQRLEKTHFSCQDDPGLSAALDAMQRPNLVVAGIEAHVCVLGTVADRIAAGQNVVVCFDAVASRRGDHRDHALAAMRDLGALVVPVESVLFRLQRQAGVGDFKILSALVR